MRPFIFHMASPERRASGDRRIAVPEIAGNFDDLARTADWVPFSTPEPEADRRVIGDELPPDAGGWLTTRAMSPAAL